MNLVSSPAYSIRGDRKSELGKNNGTPGPGSYEKNSSMKIELSLSKISKGKRFQDYNTLAPGPGNYEYKNTTHVPSAMILSRQKDKKVDEKPGPGAYEADTGKFVKSQSSYRLGKAQKLPDLSKNTKYIPGPGQYETAKSTLLGKNNGVGFGPERKIVLGVDPKTPGPGQYQQTAYYNGSSVNQPKYGFSKSSRSHSLNTLGPGPANYSSTGTFDTSGDKKKGFQMGSRLKTIQDSTSKVPGPGAYKSETAMLKKSMPSFSMGKEGRLKIQNERELMSKPGPYQYEPHVSSFNHKSFAIGKDKRKGLENISLAPGPGAYQIKINTNQPQFSISKGMRSSTVGGNASPGPGDYSPKEVLNGEYKNIGMGKDERKTFKNYNNTPGPGNYLIEEKKTGGYSIGHQKRGFIKADDRPGPGNYDLSSTISNLPGYARKGK